MHSLNVFVFNSIKTKDTSFYVFYGFQGVKDDIQRNA
jgi:hypothetical protein